MSRQQNLQLAMGYHGSRRVVGIFVPFDEVNAELGASVRGGMSGKRGCLSILSMQRWRTDFPLALLHDSTIH